MESTTEQSVGIRELLEAGVHFGHQARRWNPKMKKYVFAERAGVRGTSREADERVACAVFEVGEPGAVRRGEGGHDSGPCH